MPTYFDNYLLPVSLLHMRKNEKTRSSPVDEGSHELFIDLNPD